MFGKIKKGFCIVLVLVTFVFIMTSCGEKSEPDTSSSVDVGTTAAEPDTSSSTDADEATKELDPASYEGTLVQWGWDEAVAEAMKTKFNKVYPNVKFEYTAVQDYLTKVQTTVASGGELPDILWAEMGSRGKMFDMDIWENLEAEPYNLDRSILLDYIIPLESNAAGQIIAIDNSISPAAMAYKRDLAKEYFGTDDPKALSEILSDWNTFIEKGKEVLQKSGGKVFMLPSIGDAFQILDGQSSTPTMDGDSINITGRIKGTLDIIEQMRDAGILNKMDMWSPAWNASFADKNNIFFACANWSPQYQIKANDTNGEGNWGIMIPPEGPFSWGGTAFGISKQSKNKDIAWQFIKWSFTSSEGIQQSARNEKKYPPIKNAYADSSLISDTDPYFGGQDIGKFWFDEVIPKIDVRGVTKYDNIISDTATLVIKAMISDNSMTADTALQNFIKEVQNKAPDITVK